jgi:hypothetical protein
LGCLGLRRGWFGFVRGHRGLPAFREPRPTRRVPPALRRPVARGLPFRGGALRHSGKDSSSVRQAKCEGAAAPVQVTLRSAR